VGDTHYERLSAMDSMFLDLEDANVHMHIGSVALFEAAPLLRVGGGLDLERILAFASAQIHKSPRLRQRLATIPLFERPVWVDDPRFNLLYHVRHTALPHPGCVRQLKRLAGRILSQQLDRGKPLWEVWLIEGVEGGCFAVVTKLHHCMADGVSSGDLLSMLMGTKPDYQPGPTPVWSPREPPPGARLVLDELARRATAPLALLGGEGPLPGEAAAGSEHVLDFVRAAARGAWRAVEAGLLPVSETPLNTVIGPHRRFDWTRFALDDVKRVGHAAGGTVNDVVLALVAGATRRWLERRAAPVRGIEFRVAVPVSVRSDAERGELGNRVSTLVAPLPLEETDPWERLRRVVAATRELKRSGESRAVDLLGRLADWLPQGTMARLSRAGTRAVNMIVTNVPGPALPVYMLGARMLESYPVVPLMANEALNVALLSYDGGLFWGFHADWDAVPDLHAFAESIPAGFEELSKAAAGRAPRLD
jgi:diacylglycerol O-acyltransferase / wax synthase